MKKLCAVLVSLLVVPAVAGAADKSEIKGAAILAHACGKTSVKQMALANAGKMDEAMKLGTAEMQAEWKAMSAEERTMLSGMMKEMSVPEAEFSAKIKAFGLLVIDGADATLTVKEEHKEASGSSTSTITQKFKVDGASCLISR